MSTIAVSSVHILVGITATGIGAYTIYQGHEMLKIWRLNARRIHDEENELGSAPTTATGIHVNDAPPTHGSPLPSQPPAPTPTSEDMSDVELDVHESEPEEDELVSDPMTATGGHVNNAPPTHGSPLPSQPPAPTPTSEDMSDVEPDLRESEATQT